ncbi:MAG: hypothetical protein KF724_04520 [Phycisphaeraceae bacterium]|nr:hypothetical protein [Phycisphaeraceae bacterium]
MAAPSAREAAAGRIASGTWLSFPAVGSLPIVIVTEPLSEAPTEWLEARCRVSHGPPDSAEFGAAAASAEALIVRTATRVDTALLERLPSLRVVGRAGVGLDSIDLDACRQRGIRVVSTPDANTQAVVEYVTCLLCDALRPRLFLEAPVGDAEWRQLREDVVGLWQMSELRLGILGLGRIGSRVAEVARAIGFEVVYNDLLDIPSERRCGAMPVSLTELFAESDVISLHCDGRPSNRGFVDAGLIESMRPDVVLLNTSRGLVIDEQALARFMRRSPGASAILDVHAQEPFTETCPFLGMANVHLAPHLASRTLHAMEAMSWVVRDVWAVLEGRVPAHAAC